MTEEKKEERGKVSSFFVVDFLAVWLPKNTKKDDILTRPTPVSDLFFFVKNEKKVLRLDGGRRAMRAASMWLTILFLTGELMKLNGNGLAQKELFSSGSVRLVKRDIEILSFINQFGFCEMPHIEKRFGLKKPRSYQVIKRLIEGGFIFHERIFHGCHGIYRVTKKGAGMTDLPVLNRLDLSTYKHDTSVIDVYLVLRHRYPETHFMSERELRLEQHHKGVGKVGHLADGVLLFPDKKIAIELEFTLKGRRRLKSILEGYAKLFEIDEVWYYCSPKTLHHVRAIAQKLPYVKVFGMGEMG